jgi:hypothetical protein
MHLPEVDVPGGPRGAIGSRIQTMFADAQKVNHNLFELHFHNSVILKTVYGVMVDRIGHALCIKCMKLIVKYFFLADIFLGVHIRFG